ncbi:peptidylprolyl isomerase [Chitinolyticbacter meiyuanensis]|uniref:peptidylprolyl isomerase n=1 Tax=Chitinolyticbacter meiyuanensis TaxID=682798 RepID=UPI0011E5FA9E|nr:peptidylprolyl isomerase [Chitinolyticbacter meiyuanensis]
MPIVVNDHELSDDEVALELPSHQGVPQPLRQATLAVILRHLLHGEAEHLGLYAPDEDGLIAALLAREVVVPQPDRDSCLRHYQQHPARYTVGELVEADHILFQFTPRVPLAALREFAEATLAELLAEPERFAALAAERSNCPSAAQGGALGQLGRGQTVPEFERVLFSAAPGIVPRLIETRFGLHIVRVRHHIAGRLRLFDEVEAEIAGVLHACSVDTATRQYLKLLAGRARISGIELGEIDTPLVQ